MLHAAEFLEKYGDEILRRFEKRLQAEDSSGRMPRSQLLDYLPTYLQLLAQTLRARAGRSEEMVAAFTAVAAEHGEQRQQLGVDPGSLVREYGYLHDCILELGEEIGWHPSPAAMQELSSHINLTCSQAVARYVHRFEEQLLEQTAHHVSALAHELRDPLSSARLAMDLLSRQSDAGRTAAGHMLVSSLERLRDVIDATLTSTLLERGGNPSRATLSLKNLLTETMADSDGPAQAKGIRLALDVEEGLILEADPRLLRSAVRNLVRNAVKFSPHGTVTIRATRRGAKARVEVEDSCGGLPEGETASLFHPFVQLGRDRSGFGLGLSITQRAVKAHGGEVFAQDLPGKGCIIGFEVPLVVEGGLDAP